MVFVSGMMAYWCIMATIGPFFVSTTEATVPISRFRTVCESTPVRSTRLSVLEMTLVSLPAIPPFAPLSTREPAFLVVLTFMLYCTFVIFACLPPLSLCASTRRMSPGCASFSILRLASCCSCRSEFLTIRELMKRVSFASRSTGVSTS